MRADELQAGDTIQICGRTETVTRTEPGGHIMPGRTVHLFTEYSLDAGDPYLLHPHDLVPLLRRH